MANRPYSSVAIVGRHLPEWSETLAAAGMRVAAIDPAMIEEGEPEALADQQELSAALGSFDLVISIGLLDHANDPRLAAAILAGLLGPGGHLVGAIVGGDSLSTLRRALIDADRATGRAAQRFHPMMDGNSLASLLSEVGLSQPVVDVDRVSVSYAEPARLVADLRAMGCSRRLTAAPSPLTRSAWRAATSSLGPDRFEERFDLLHFSARREEG